MVVGGGTPKSSEPSYWTPADVAWITPKDMTALGGEPVIEGGARHISNAGLRSSSAKLLPTGAVVYTSRATLGVIAIARRPLATNQGFISLLPDPRFGSAFVYCALASVRDKINDRANGSTFMEVNKTNFKAVTCPSPAENHILAFRGTAEPLLDRIIGAIDESRTLTAIRDALLPKLVAGQIRVPLSDDPEEQIGAAAEGLEGVDATA
jgi:type I restriction enzyme S subunit